VRRFVTAALAAGFLRRLRRVWLGFVRDPAAERLSDVSPGWG
jgi:hypothetical protein